MRRGTPPGNKKEWALMAQGKKPDMRDYILCVSMYVKCPRKANLSSSKEVNSRTGGGNGD